ncbi:MAG: hypothetical protein NT067_07320 [Candidatus Diapherotrites archaeon]|nr:hypothetical protein [Candidatus Diapherotrites archaeon]
MFEVVFLRALSAMAFAALVVVLLFVSGCNEPQIVACENDSDCALGLNLDKCCSCVEAFHLSEFSSNPNLAKYEAGKDYNYYRPLIKANCGNQECKMCQSLEQAKAVCENKKCTAKFPQEECSMLELKIREEMEKLNHCEKAGNCAAKYPGCPFGCQMPINKAEDTLAIEQKMKEYNAQCEQCLYDCADLPKDFNCLQGKCVPAGTCRGYEGGTMSQEEMQSCTCPEGQTKMRCLASAYCATQSMKECKSSEDCPEGERCISSDGTNWHCTGQQCGCYYPDPKDPEMQICAD